MDASSPRPVPSFAPLPGRDHRKCGLLAASGCGGVSSAASASSGQVQHDARVVFRADLRPGSTGQAAALIAQRFILISGVSGTRGDGGRHVWIYTTPDVTSAEVAAIRQDLSRDPSVASVERTR
jgi:hypothetical protein